MTAPVRVGLIGLGFARTVQLPVLTACPGLEVRVVCGAHVEKARAVAREFSIPHVVGDWREVVAHPEVDLVSLVTPPGLHRDMALGALEAGKALLCEKPAALDASEAEAMWRSARARGSLALIDHELRLLPAFQAASRLIADGALGVPRHARVHYRADGRALPSMPWTWWSDAEQGGGILGAIGSHAVDSLRFLLGREPTGVLGALATHLPPLLERATGQPRPVTADDEAQVLMRFGPALTAAVSLSAVEPGEPVHTIEVFGSEGGLRLQHCELWRSRVGGRSWEPVPLPPPRPLPPRLPDTEWARGFLYLALALADALGHGRGAPDGAATLEDGWRNQLVLDAARRSHREQKWVALAGPT